MPEWQTQADFRQVLVKLVDDVRAQTMSFHESAVQGQPDKDGRDIANYAESG